jgi:hypothetical protein
MEETGELRYLKWEELTRRDQEMSGVKKEDLWKEDADGHLKRVYKETEAKSEPKDLMAMRYALQRRGLAMEVSKLMTFRAHEKVVNTFFEALSRNPVPNYAAVTIEQVRRTDKEIFMRLAELTRSGFAQTGDPEKLPLDDPVMMVIDEPRIQALLFELPLGTGSAGSNRGGQKRGNEDNEQRLREEVKRLKAALGKGNAKGQGNGGGKGDRKGKGGGKNKRKGSPNMPQALIGMDKNVNGKPICFDFNMKKGCTHHKADRCPSGEHLCAYPGCGGRHSLTECSKR